MRRCALPRNAFESAQEAVAVRGELRRIIVPLDSYAGTLLLRRPGEQRMGLLPAPQQGFQGDGHGTDVVEQVAAAAERTRVCTNVLR